MRISDWSSDVCSSDLYHAIGRHVLLAQNGLFRPQASAAGQSRAKGAYSAFSACCKLILAHSGRYMPTTSPGKYRERRGMLLPITLTFAATAALLKDRKSTSLNSSH